MALGLAQARALAADPPVPSRTGAAATTATIVSAVAVAPNAAVASNAEVEALTIDADRLDLDAAARSAVLTGKVRIVRGGLVVSAPRVEVRYAEDGGSPRVTWARASDGVVVVMKGARAEAPEVELDVLEHLLELRGGVRVAHGGGWLTAQRASIHTETLKLSMHDVKGSLPIGPTGLPPR